MTFGSILLFIVVVQINQKRKNLLKDNKIRSFENETQIFLLGTTMEIQEREKERIYRNFHDQVNPMLRFVMRRIERHRTELVKNTLHVNSLNEDIDMLLKILDGIKACTYDLVPSFMMDVGLVKSLEDIIQKLNSPGSVTTSFSNGSSSHNVIFTQLEQLNIYRITLEIINNILQHSSCTTLHMNISNMNGRFLIELKHNGKGISNLQVDRLTREGSGHGLKSCKARALMLNASIDYFFSPRSPMVIISVPYLK
jgi:signal transduction histidine kinase